jgi:hypothetical protein
MNRVNDESNKATAPGNLSISQKEPNPVLFLLHPGELQSLFSREPGD